MYLHLGENPIWFSSVVTQNKDCSNSPVISWFDLDKIATEIIFAANLSEKPSKQHIQNRPKSDMGKYANLHE